jgi:uncharacterized membrane protein
MAWLAAYGAALLALGVLDAIWLGVVARELYQREIGELLAPEVRWSAGVLFYLAYPLGVLALALQPDTDSLRAVLARAAAVGLLAYATYDLTNMATLRVWSWKLVGLDVAWGIFITTCMGAAAFAAFNAVARRAG